MENAAIAGTKHPQNAATEIYVLNSGILRLSGHLLHIYHIIAEELVRQSRKKKMKSEISVLMY